MSVRTYSNLPPAAITDLLASPNPSIAGQVSLTWTAPQGYSGEITGATVQSYSVHYATYSVDSLLGDTTSWWNATMASSTTLQAPTNPPQPPGNTEFYTLTGLAPDTTYYFAIRSTGPVGKLSIIDTESSTPGQQAFALTSSNLSPPATFSGTAISPTSIQWNWSAVPAATSYLVYSSPGNVLLQTISAPTTFWNEPSLAVNVAYTRKVRATDGVTTTGDSPTATVYTQANVPTTLSATSITTNSIGLSWSANGNPAGTAFGLERSLDNVTFVSISTTAATSYNDTGLTLGTSYYYRLRAMNGDGIPTAYTSTLATFTASSSTPPMAPNGLDSDPISNGLQVTLSWTAVTTDTSGAALTTDHYLIYRYSTIGDTPTVVATVAAPSTAHTITTGGITAFYRVQAVSSAGATSQLSDYLDSNGNRYALADDDPDTRVVMPHTASPYLLAANNPYKQDLDIVLIHQPQDEVNVTLRSYKISARITATGEMLTNFTFPQNNISVQLGYGTAISGTRPSNATIQQPATSARGAGSIAQIVSVYWYNGSSYVSVGEPTLTSGASIAVTVRNLGIYQIRAVSLGVKFKLSQGSPYPRVITPNGAENRRVFWFFDNPAGDTVTGSIYDIRGAKVRDLAVGGMSPTPNSLVWDGRDGNGAVVPSGVYLYKISTPDETVTGTVVVAR